MAITQADNRMDKLKKYKAYKCLQVRLQFSPLKLGNDLLATWIIALYQAVLTFSKFY